jgi:hypothetical protein
MQPHTTSTSLGPSADSGLTAAEFARRHGDANLELVRGQVKELPMPFPKHGKICRGSDISSMSTPRNTPVAM